jgi:hypothetical protein
LCNFSERIVLSSLSSAWHSRTAVEGMDEADKVVPIFWEAAASEACWVLRSTEVRLDSSRIYELTHAFEDPLMLATYWKLSCESWRAKLTNPATEAAVLRGSAIRVM